jgi:pimeloyl-ACP methyl ester carboxylesterase
VRTRATRAQPSGAGQRRTWTHGGRLLWRVARRRGRRAARVNFRPPRSLRSPFASLASVGKHHYPFLPVRWLLRDRYPTIDRIARIQSPLLVVAGDTDQVVPIGESEAVFNAAPYPKRLVVLPGADHNDAELVSGPARSGPSWTFCLRRHLSILTRLVRRINEVECRRPSI